MALPRSKISNAPTPNLFHQVSACRLVTRLLPDNLLSHGRRFPFVSSVGHRCPQVLKHPAGYAECLNTLTQIRLISTSAFRHLAPLKGSDRPRFIEMGGDNGDGRLGVLLCREVFSTLRNKLKIAHHNAQATICQPFLCIRPLNPKNFTKVIFFLSFFFNFYCYSITVICLFSPSLHPTLSFYCCSITVVCIFSPP